MTPGKKGMVDFRDRDYTTLQEDIGPLVSVIVPVYNVRPYIAEALDSLVAQTYGRLEILLVDDGSTDGSGEVCDRYASRDARLPSAVAHAMSSSSTRAAPSSAWARTISMNSLGLSL